MSYSDQKMQNLLKKQKYQLYGKNTSVKKCRWTHNALREDRYCYKRFYGIRSHQCVQFSPTLICNFACQFCWRIHERDIGLPNMYDSYERHNKEKLEEMFDRPKEVVKGIFFYTYTKGFSHRYRLLLDGGGFPNLSVKALRISSIVMSFLMRS